MIEGSEPVLHRYDSKKKTDTQSPRPNGGVLADIFMRVFTWVTCLWAMPARGLDSSCVGRQAGRQPQLQICHQQVSQERIHLFPSGKKWTWTVVYDSEADDNDGDRHCGFTCRLMPYPFTAIMAYCVFKLPTVSCSRRLPELGQSSIMRRI